MSACARFGEEELLRLEQGLPLDAHFEGCPDCQAARARYEALASDLASLRDDFAPPPDWQRRVLERAGRDARARRAAGPSWAAAAAVLAAVAALLAPPRTDPGPALDVRTQAAPSRSLRGATAQAGDRLLLRARVGRDPHVELRVYRDDAALVLRCSSGAPCRRERGTLQAELLLAEPGSYQSLLLLSELPLPEPRGALDADAADAFAAGARVVLGTEVVVR